MPLLELIQKAIHALEVGAAARYLRFIVLGLAILALVLTYDLRAYRNLATPEGMDAAQLARNISEGKGYTTQFIRPLSLYLVQSRNHARADSLTTTNRDFAQIKTAHPDLANPPAYPVLLAGLMKILPFDYAMDLKSPFWSDNGRFALYKPDFLIALINQVFLLAVVVLTFFLARKLFDVRVAWTAAILTIGCELLWRFSTSGLSTMLLLVIFLGLAWVILRIEEAGREQTPNPKRLLLLAATAGVIVGIGALTRYAFAWAIIPVALFLVFFAGPKRAIYPLLAVGAFAGVLIPWIVRNFMVSGTPFGTAGFALVEGTFLFPRFQLERSLTPDFSKVWWLKPYLYKLFGNARAILQNDLPKLGGSWAAMLFMVGLLLGFRGLAIKRMRYFLLMCLGTFIIFQALGRTYLSDESPEMNSENLLVLLVPLAFIYGVALFFTLLDRVQLPLIQLRYLVIGVFVALCCLPLISALMPPKASPVAYPPYYPPDIQHSAGWMKESELMMSDVPWAVAWYGQRQCIWLTLNAESDFFNVYDNYKAVQALYLTPETMDGKFLTDWVRAGGRSWGSFIIQSVVQNQIPSGFPLRRAPTGFLPERLFLTDWDRWKMAEVISQPQ
ncbi:MAG: glycosyltransferase family 39 protein [Limisphaerales bacterium]